MTAAPLSVLFVVHQFVPRHLAGSELYTFHLARELQARGHRVAVYTTEAYVGESTATLREREHEGLRIFEAVHNNECEDFEHSYLDPEKEAQFERVLDAVCPDIVHVQHLAMHSHRYLSIAKARGLTLVYTLHEFALMCIRFGWLVRPGWELCQGPSLEACTSCAPTCLPAPRAGASDAAWRAAVAERSAFVADALQLVDLFVSPSRFLRDRFVAAGFVGADRILYSDNGLPTDAYTRLRRKRGDRVRFGFVGTIAEWKGVHLLVEACNQLPHDLVECEIWGILDYFPDYVAELRARLTHPRVTFRGRYENGSVGDVLARFDCLVVPSLWFENSPLTIHEAFLAGVPVITADQGGMAEYVIHERNGLLFRMHDAEDLCRQMQRIAEHPSLLDRLREFPEVKDVATDAALMETRYRQLLAGEVPSA